MSEDITVKIDENGADVIQYAPQGVCSKVINLKIKDGIILDAEFIGGCPGNLYGISKIIIGMNINDVCGKFKGTPCGSRGTSCPDQLSKCLSEYITMKQAVNA